MRRICTCIAAGLLAICTAAAQDFLPVLRRTVEVTDFERYDVGLRRGESAIIERTFKNDGTSIALTNATTVLLRYTPVDPGTNTTHHSVTGSLYSAAAGIVRVTWTPAAEGTADAYEYEIAVSDGDYTMVRSFGTLRLSAGVGDAGSVSSEPREYSTLDWELLENSNLSDAPFPSSTSVTESTNASTAAISAGVLSLNLRRVPAADLALFAQAVVDAGDWTNWWANNGSAWAALTNDQAAYNAHTQGWITAEEWVTAWSSRVAYVASRTGAWDQAVLDLAFVESALNVVSGDVDQAESDIDSLESRATTIEGVTNALGSAAFTASGDYATDTQGATADAVAALTNNLAGVAFDGEQDTLETVASRYNRTTNDIYLTFAPTWSVLRDSPRIWFESALGFPGPQTFSNALVLQNAGPFVRETQDGTQYRIWDSASDGALTGMDSDLLDGQHGSYYTDGANVDAGSLTTNASDATMDAAYRNVFGSDPGAILTDGSRPMGASLDFGGNWGTNTVGIGMPTSYITFGAGDGTLYGNWSFEGGTHSMTGTVDGGGTGIFTNMAVLHADKGIFGASSVYIGDAHLRSTDTDLIFDLPGENPDITVSQVRLLDAIRRNRSGLVANTLRDEVDSAYYNTPIDAGEAWSFSRTITGEDPVDLALSSDDGVLWSSDTYTLGLELDFSGDQHMHYYLDDNAASSTVLDNEGNENGSLYDNTTAVNTSTRSTTGLLGDCLTFNDTAITHVRCGYQIDDLLRASDFSMSMWIKLADGQGTAGHYICGVRNATDGISISINSLGEYGYRIAGDSTATLLYSPAAFPDGPTDWEFVVFTWELSTKNMMIFADGTRVASNTAALTPATCSMADDFYLGAWNYNSAPGSAGGTDAYIDDFRLHTRLLSASEILALYNGGAGLSVDTISAATNVLQLVSSNLYSDVSYTGIEAWLYTDGITVSEGATQLVFAASEDQRATWTNMPYIDVRSLTDTALAWKYAVYNSFSGGTDIAWRVCASQSVINVDVLGVALGYEE